MLVPQTFRDMPRWWNDEPGRAWLDQLPELAADQFHRWRLTPDGPPWHGSNALVLPVLRGAERLALRLLPPGDDIAAEVRALRFWDGKGTVRLIEADPDRSATLLERLDGSRTLLDVELDHAVPVLASMMRRLARPAPDDVLETALLARKSVDSFAKDWERLNRPSTPQILEAAIDAAERLTQTGQSGLAVNGDLHYEQVLAAEREPWLVVDPVLYRGDIEYDLARFLWTRLDEMPTDHDVLRHFGRAVDVAEVPAERARDWVMVRSMSYLLWGLDRGLTWDPPKCLRLLALFSAS